MDIIVIHVIYNSDMESLFVVSSNSRSIENEIAIVNRQLKFNEVM